MITPRHLTKPGQTSLFNYLKLNRAYRSGQITHSTLMEHYLQLPPTIQHIILQNSKITFQTIETGEN